MTSTVTINQIFTTGFFSNSLKTAKILSFLKAGDLLLGSNDRPISLLTSISKFLDFFFNQLANYLILTDSQYGFRENHSTQSIRINR